MVGLDDTTEFPSGVCDVRSGDQLYVYSDGVFEICKSDGEMWTYREFLKFMSLSNSLTSSPIDRLLTHVRQLQESESFDDDFSMVHLVF